ncbi:MAG: hypothetical protein MHMPM18_000421 [Marteilia pararefringens]
MNQISKWNDEDLPDINLPLSTHNTLSQRSASDGFKGSRNMPGSFLSQVPGMNELNSDGSDPLLLTNGASDQCQENPPDETDEKSLQANNNANNLSETSFNNSLDSSDSDCLDPDDWLTGNIVTTEDEHYRNFSYSSLNHGSCMTQKSNYSGRLPGSNNNLSMAQDSGINSLSDIIKKSYSHIRGFSNLKNTLKKYSKILCDQFDEFRPLKQITAYTEASPQNSAKAEQFINETIENCFFTLSPAEKILFDKNSAKVPKTFPQLSSLSNAQSSAMMIWKYQPKDFYHSIDSIKPNSFFLTLNSFLSKWTSDSAKLVYSLFRKHGTNFTTIAYEMSNNRLEIQPKTVPEIIEFFYKNHHLMQSNVDISNYKTIGLVNGEFYAKFKISDMINPSKYQTNMLPSYDLPSAPSSIHKNVHPEITIHQFPTTLTGSTGSSCSLKRNKTNVGNGDVKYPNKSSKGSDQSRMSKYSETKADSGPKKDQTSPLASVETINPNLHEAMITKQRFTNSLTCREEREVTRSVSTTKLNDQCADDHHDSHASQCSHKKQNPLLNICPKYMSDLQRTFSKHSPAAPQHSYEEVNSMQCSTSQENQATIAGQQLGRNPNTILDDHSHSNQSIVNRVMTNYECYSRAERQDIHTNTSIAKRNGPRCLKSSQRNLNSLYKHSRSGNFSPGHLLDWTNSGNQRAYTKPIRYLGEYDHHHSTYYPGYGHQEPNRLNESNQQANYSDSIVYAINLRFLHENRSNFNMPMKYNEDQEFYQYKSPKFADYGEHADNKSYDNFHDGYCNLFFCQDCNAYHNVDEIEENNLPGQTKHSDYRFFNSSDRNCSNNSSRQYSFHHSMSKFSDQQYHNEEFGINYVNKSNHMKHSDLHLTEVTKITSDRSKSTKQDEH